MTLITTGDERQRRSARTPLRRFQIVDDAIDRKARLDLSLSCSWSRLDQNYTTIDLMRNAKSATATTPIH